MKKRYKIEGGVVSPSHHEKLAGALADAGTRLRVAPGATIVLVDVKRKTAFSLSEELIMIDDIRRGYIPATTPEDAERQCAGAARSFAKVFVDAG